MARLRVLGGDFVEHPGSNYFMGEFTLWGWKEGQTKPVRVRLRAKRDVAEVKLKGSDAIPANAMGASGAVKGAVMGAAVGGPVGAVAGAIVGGAASVASAKTYNALKRNGLQRFTVTFGDGRKLEAEMDVRMVAALQNRLLRRRKA